MSVKVNVIDNNSNIRTKTSSKDDVAVKSNCNIQTKVLDAKIDKEIEDRKAADTILQLTKQNLGFIILDGYFVPGTHSGNLPQSMLNLLISYLINKVSINGHIYYLSKVEENNLLSFICPDLGVELNQVDINKTSGLFHNGLSVLDHNRLNNLDWRNSGHTGFAGIEFGTTEYWSNRRDYIPPEGMLVVYTDHGQTETGEDIPAFKISTGNAYLIDMPFIGFDIIEALEEHVANTTVHITQEERERWNNKLNYIEPTSDLLILTRN